MTGMYEQPGVPDVTRFAAVSCIGCGHVMDATAASDGRPVMPVDGDFTMCMYCAEPQVFVIGALGVSVRPMTPGESAEFEVDFGAQRRELLAVHQMPEWKNRGK